MKAYITHVAYALPAGEENNAVNRLTKKLGIFSRHIAAKGETAADLAFQAGEKLKAQGLLAETDFLLFCTQSPDYILPTSACLLQERLGLPQSCGALDFNLGCSGYVYGLGLAKGLIESGQARKVLLLTGETYSKYIHPEDSSVKPVFGDGGTATLIQGMEQAASGIQGLVYGTDGRGADKLIVPAGGQRQPFGTEVQETADAYGSKRTNYNLYMDGSGIMNFALQHVPEAVEQILSKTGMRKTDVDYYVFHQANHFMLEYLQQQCGLLGMPFWNDVERYGNTVSNSIPIALADMLGTRQEKLQHVMLIGFGVGLSWGGCMVDLHFAAQNSFSS